VTDKNIYLTGFMGTGKSVVGQELGRRLRRRFVDLDGMVERTANKKVAEIFANDGEREFRRLERAALAQVARKKGLIVALGGGALIDSRNTALVENGVLVKLTCSRRELVRRLKPSRFSRPILAGGTLDNRVGVLLRERRGAHGKAQIIISTTKRSTDAVAAVIARRLK
jgi:shikimate kinase